MDEISIPLEKQWLSVADIAVYMGVSPHVVTSMLRAGEMPAVKFGREWRVARADLQKYLNQARQRLA
jgi:excisionase family DNA binding protein